MGEIVFNYDSAKKVPCPGRLEVHASTKVLLETFDLFREEINE